jgi:predicted transcriptional regulator of viral defense system
MVSRVEILDDFVAEGRESFTSAHVRERLGLSAAATSNLIGRWVRDGFVDRVSRGQYVVRPLGALGTRAASQDVALAVGAAFGGAPHRIGYRSALDHHDLLTHPARTIQVASATQRRLRTISGRKLRMVSEPERFLEIGAEPAGHGAIVSDHVRAIVDVALRPDLGGGPVVLAEALSARSVDPTALKAMAQALDANAALRRIGSIADRLEIAGLAGKLSPLKVPRSDIDLDTRDTHREYRDPDWCVSWPLTPDDLAMELRQ